MVRAAFVKIVVADGCVAHESCKWACSILEGFAETAPWTDSMKTDGQDSGDEMYDKRHDPTLDYRLSYWPLDAINSCPSAPERSGLIRGGLTGGAHDRFSRPPPALAAAAALL